MEEGKLENFCFVMHNCTRSPSPMLVSHREFVCIGCLLVKDGQAAVVFESVEYNETTKDTVRG